MAQKIRLEDRECPLSATLGLVGEWWTLLILHDAFDGYSRFDQFQENLGISSSLLASRLKRLVSAGLLDRRQYQANPARYEYLLTELGRSLRPVVVVLAAWGNARLAPTERSMVLVDAQTGAEAEPVLVDRATGRRVDGPDFVFTAGPAASRGPLRSAPQATAAMTSTCSAEPPWALGCPAGLPNEAPLTAPTEVTARAGPPSGPRPARARSSPAHTTGASW